MEDSDAGVGQHLDRFDKESLRDARDGNDLALCGRGQENALCFVKTDSPAAGIRAYPHWMGRVLVGIGNVTQAMSIFSFLFQISA